MGKKSEIPNDSAQQIPSEKNSKGKGRSKKERPFGHKDNERRK